MILDGRPLGIQRDAVSLDFAAEIFDFLLRGVDLSVAEGVFPAAKLIAHTGKITIRQNQVRIPYGSLGGHGTAAAVGREINSVVVGKPLDIQRLTICGQVIRCRLCKVWVQIPGGSLIAQLGVLLVIYRGLYDQRAADRERKGVQPVIAGDKTAADGAEISIMA